jgi:hypothetical protein
MANADRDATRKALSKPAAFVVLRKGLALKKELTAERLRELLRYDPETGLFSRLIPAGGRNGKKFPAGMVVGSVGSLGYLEVGIDGGNYLLHRLAVLRMTGKWPTDQVDHMNGCRSDNRWSNLREVDNTTNIENRWKPNKNNKSGILGIHLEGRSGKWIAQITVQRKTIVIGRFSDAKSASDAYIQKKRKLHKGNTL